MAFLKDRCLHTRLMFFDLMQIVEPIENPQPPTGGPGS